MTPRHADERKSARRGKAELARVAPSHCEASPHGSCVPAGTSGSCSIH